VKRAALPYFQHLGAADYRVMPWKNGLGTTTEIAIHPPSADLAGTPFDWRVSMADVNADGDFSLFPGYDRTIMVATGAGMELDFDAAPGQMLQAPGAMTAFSGDRRTHCRLLRGPVRDFNVMSRRGRVEHHCDAVSDGPLEFIWEPGSEAFLCYCISGTLVLKMRSLREWELEEDQCLLFPAGQEDSLRSNLVTMPHTRGSLGVLVRLRRMRTDKMPHDG